MPHIPVFYATTDGHSRRIAERMAATLNGLGVASRAIDVTTSEARAIDWTNVDAAIVGASVHAGSFQRAAESFVRDNLAALNARPTVFFAVGLGICSSIPSEVGKARALARAFPEKVGWQPSRIAPIAGRLAYREYGLLKRWMMRRIVGRSGGPTDTSRNHELTDWNEVAAIAASLAALVQVSA